MKRTGSIGSRVPPAVTRTLSPVRSVRAGGEQLSSAATIVAGSASRPGTDVAAGEAALSGSTTWTPRRAQQAEVVLHRRVLPHLGVHRRAHEHRRAGGESTLVSRSSLMPRGVQAEDLAVAGATTTRSAGLAEVGVGIGCGSSQSEVQARSEPSASKVVRPTKCWSPR